MKSQQFRWLEVSFFCVGGWLCACSPAGAQFGSAPPTTEGGGQPIVVHVHNHFYQNPWAPSQGMASYYSPTYAWNYGYQPGLGTIYSPWTQNWGHLGFTAYMGEHGGGVDPTLHTFAGLVVNTVKPGGPADKIGLVPGDFILKINGTSVDSYKQATILFDETLQGAKPEIELTVWNPYSRRTSVLTAIIEKN